MQLVLLDGLTQGLARAEQMGLPDVLFQAPWPQTLGQRLKRGCSVLLEKVHGCLHLFENVRSGRRLKIEQGRVERFTHAHL